MEAKIFDQNLTFRGTLPVLGGQAILRNTDVSTFSIDINANSAMWARFEHGWHVLIEDDGRQMLTGIPDKITETAAKGIRDVTLSGLCHMRYLRDMVTIPDPARPVTSQSDSAYYKRSGLAETVVKDMVRSHVGQDARPENKRLLVVDPDKGLGKQVAINSRFQNLLEEVKSIAAAGGIRVQARMIPAGAGHEIRLGVVEGRDLQKAVRLSQINGALDGYTLEESAPTLTRVLVGGQGEGAARTLILREGNPNDWGVNVLQFQDRRDTDDDADLRQAGDETLEEGQASASISIEVNEIPHLRFGERFDLGDTVKIELNTGVEINDVVQSADITWSETGRAVKLQVGPVAEDLDAPAWVKRVHELRSQLRRIQAR